MERRKESLSNIKTCRFCLCQDPTLSSIYDRERDPLMVTLPLKIMTCLSIEVFPSDKMPSYICERCRTFMNICYDFKQICRRADESCLQFVQNCTPLKPINWPPSLTKIFQLKKRIKPRDSAADGSSIQAAADMSENYDEDSYNAKIDVSGDGSKSFANADKEAPSTPKKETARKGVMVRVRRRSAGLGTWPCDQCDSSYSLHQLLDIHKAQKHRARNFQCNQCDAKFFSKYDLMTHQLRHTNEMPFQCVACNSKFKRLILLKRHEKMAHSNLPKHMCTNCPVTFLSKEELAAHRKRHEGYFSRQHVCTICDRKFHTKGTLQRHRDVVHGKKQFSCEYCPHRFSTVSKLARHVRAHAGERAYPCKYCNKSFLKSHHYTRHLRLQHEEQVRAARGDDAEFRCEQCSEGFATQDDLYYHSAIHATQSLICPLCQEKFENVDAVTTHIRTHVNGIEFMCEYCELVFTSKEKLDAHMGAAHQDEITPRQELGLDESSLEADGGEADADDDDEDNGLNVKEEGDLMVVEIKKADGYMIQKSIEVGQTTNTTSEDSEMEATYTELSTVDTLALVGAAVPPPTPTHAPSKAEATTSQATSSTLPAKAGERIGILRKAEAIKRKAVDKEDSVVPRKKGQPGKVDSTTNNASSSVKSLRMLEKELQELKRTNARPEKPVKMGEIKSKRQAAHSCTPKLRSVEEKKIAVRQSGSVEKRTFERRPVAKDSKEARNAVSSTKEDKSVSSTKEDKASTSERSERYCVNSNDKRRPKEDESSNRAKAIAQETPKAVNPAKVKVVSKEEASSSKSEVASTSSKRHSEDCMKDDSENFKNGDASSSEEVVRRSTRPSKIKNYASMARDGAGHVHDEDEEEMDDSDAAEPKVADDGWRFDSRTPAGRRGTPKRGKAPTPVAAPAQASAPAAAPAQPPKRRGRPRKDGATPSLSETSSSKDGAEAVAPLNEADASNASQELNDIPEEPKTSAEVPGPSKEPAQDSVEPKLVTSPVTSEAQPSATMVSPTGQTLKKVPIQALPPGVKPLPLPVNTRLDLCQMQIGQKMVKVQRIVMTKTEVEAMTKKGLLEIKDGTMVLKRGIKLPEGDMTSIRSGFMSQQAVQQMASTPSRCNTEPQET